MTAPSVVACHACGERFTVDTTTAKQLRAAYERDGRRDSILCTPCRATWPRPSRRRPAPAVTSTTVLPPPRFTPWPAPTVRRPLPKPPRRSSEPPAAELLLEELHALETAGRSWPCKGRDEWISEDHHERATAAELCAGCPVLDLCADMAAETKAKFGVYAARDLTPTPRKKAS